MDDDMEFECAENYFHPPGWESTVNAVKLVTLAELGRPKPPKKSKKKKAGKRKKKGANKIL